MIRPLSFALALLALPLPVLAQEQQAGAATDTDAAFQALIDACDDVDALMLRARIRLQLPRTTPEAAATSEEMMNQAFAICGEGELEAAKTQLTEALEIAEAGASEVFATEEAEAAAAAASDEGADAPAQDAAAEKSSPWWKFW